jgi:hypothetical protein
MQFIQGFLCFLVFMSLSQASLAEPIMCDPSQKITVKMKIEIPEPTLNDLQSKGVEELTITPAKDLFWGQKFPVEEETEICLYDVGDPLTMALQEGLLVTYPVGCDQYKIYAFCQMDNVYLDGELPKEVTLYLSPLLDHCRIEVCDTQCP